MRVNRIRRGWRTARKEGRCPLAQEAVSTASLRLGSGPSGWRAGRDRNEVEGTAVVPPAAAADSLYHILTRMNPYHLQLNDTHFLKNESCLNGFLGFLGRVEYRNPPSPTPTMTSMMNNPFKACLILLGGACRTEPAAPEGDAVKEGPSAPAPFADLLEDTSSGWSFVESDDGATS